MPGCEPSWWRKGGSGCGTSIPRTPAARSSNTSHRWCEMRILFAVQRYGTEVAGGAEAACRELAWRLAARGHEVHVVTSCAQSYVDWANAYPEGDTTIDGVTVHRLAVAHARDNRFFGPLNGRAVWGHKPNPLFLQ